MSPRKEPHFFATDLRWKWEWHVADEAKYLALFEDAENAKLIGEASTWYLYSPGAASRIKTFNSDARIIAMVRNPVEMIRSLHWHGIRNGNEELYDLDAALEAETDRRDGHRIPKTVPFADALFYRAVPLYAQQIRRYFDTFGRERVLVIVFDDFVKDPAREYLKTVKFLEIGTGFVPEFAVANPGTAPSELPFPRFLKRHRALHRLTQSTIPLSWRQAAGRLLKRAKADPPPRPPITPERESELRTYFTPEVETLSRLLDRDLTHWCRAG